MRKNWLERQRAEDVPALLQAIIHDHPNWPKALIKREYRKRRGGEDWMTAEAARTKAKLDAVDAEVKALAQPQEARRT